MANPTPYHPSFSFSGYQATTPDQPLPGQRVDDEYANIEQALGDTQTALAQVRRSDGALQNGIVTPESFAPGVTTGIFPPTIWATATHYVPLSSVWQNNKLYQCRVDHVSGVFATDLANGDWQLVVDFAVPLDAAAASAAQAAASAAAALAQANRAQAISDAMLPDAPSDGKLYGRKNAAWVDVTTAGAPVNNPVFTGDPRAPTPAPGDNDTSLATTAFVTAADVALKAAIVGGASVAMDTFGEVETAVNLKAPLANPIFTGDARAVTPTAGDNDTSIATTAFVVTAIAGKLDASAYTAADVLAKTKTVDGAGSGLDADLLDGQDGAFYLALANETGTISDAQHGNRGGGALHAAATAATAGFFTDAASDGVTYGRKNGVWAATAAGLADAVSDGFFYARMNAAWNRVLGLVGGTLSGDLTIAQAATHSTLHLDKPVGAFYSLIRGKRAGVQRWHVSPGNSTNEPGSANAGSDFDIGRYTDAGAFIDSPLTISRSTGVVAMVDGATLAGGAAAVADAPSDGTRYVRKDGAWAKPTWEELFNQVVAAQATVPVVGLANYKYLRIRGQITVSQAGAALGLQFSTDNGATYLQAASDYNLMRSFSSSGSITGGAVVSVTSVQIDANTGMGTVVQDFCSFTIDVEALNQATASTGHVSCHFRDNTGNALKVADTYFETNQRLVHNAVRLMLSGGTMSGPILVEGCR